MARAPSPPADDERLTDDDGWSDPEARPATAENAHLAASLREAAALLEAQGEDGFRARAYRRGARTLDHLPEDASVLLARDGTAGLTALPGIGRGIARAVQELVHLGSWGYLERLRGEHDPEHELMRIPGIGPALARQIHHDLDVNTLEDLELAAHDGRLAQVPGLGERRVHAIDAILASVLGHRLARTAPHGPRPDVATVLDVDREYREGAARDELPRITPKRMNEGDERWLPILHTARGPWRFTALFSNTPRAHELGHTHDWVVVYFHPEEGGPEGQNTVVTEWRGPHKGERIVRGREHE